ncbi:hypothetical protein [Paracidovorax citrulli]|uniref:hypothetical protein n=1 Tax=Paracidovorax citrulli TaxID=80869 RepID=UPI0002E017BC|nr:hypothetical protein [Paracidovorax citrulli]QCX11753.1 hypothetical protein APS58_2959 [Paracidovorax citrulli]UEG45281.1 hypothetical protein LKW27_16745 [Paracidovorax citrulli]UEG47439.1 hypothetical protein LKW27_06105 [Paracidovorax citrulli]
MADNTGGQTLTVLVQPAPPDANTLADLGELFVLFFGAAMVIFCLRRLYDLFRVDHDRD